MPRRERERQRTDGIRAGAFNTPLRDSSPCARCAFRFVAVLVEVTFANVTRLTGTQIDSDFATPFERLRHRHLIRIFEIAADRQSEREARRLHARRPELLRDV